MELKIAERIREYRRKKNITQEQMAQSLGMSAQSVSKWECGNGYPDIALLPKIAVYLGVSVDELLGTDEVSVEADKNAFFSRDLQQDSEDLFTYDLKYYYKYPTDYHIAMALARDVMNMPEDIREKHTSLLYRACEKIILECKAQKLRREAINIMCLVCRDEDVEKWLAVDNDYKLNNETFIREERYIYQKREKEAFVYYAMNNVIMCVKLLRRLEKRTTYCCSTPQEAIMVNKEILCRIKTMCSGTDDHDIPDGWLGEYSYHLLSLAAAYCGNGDIQLGLSLLERVYKLCQKMEAIPDNELLCLGNSIFFGQTKITRPVDGHVYYVLPDGTRYMVMDGLRQNIKLYDILMAPVGWDWFDAVRSDVRYQAVVAAARQLET